MDDLEFYYKLYKKYKFQALCLDIETVSWNGAVSVVGLYQPKNGSINCESFVRGKNLSFVALKKAFFGCKLIITFNGLNFDIPHLNKMFPGVLPDVPVLDLYWFAKEIGLGTGLLTLESNFNISRPRYVSRKKIAVKLWKNYMRTKKKETLDKLIEYNRQDTINLYPLAEALMAKYNSK